MRHEQFVADQGKLPRTFHRPNNVLNANACRRMDVAKLLELLLGPLRFDSLKMPAAPCGGRITLAVSRPPQRIFGTRRGAAAIAWQLH
jgi:hypothetical protein